jgi:hypothetical protein
MRMWYTVKVVEIDSGREHVLPADTVTCDAPPAPAHHACAAGATSAVRAPLVPLAFRPRRDVFYVSTGRWPQLAGKSLRVKNAHG